MGSLNDFGWSQKSWSGPDHARRVVADVAMLAEKIAKEEDGQSLVSPDNQMFALIEELCFCYLQEDDAGRKRIRDFIHDIKGGIRSPGLIYIVPNAIYGFIGSIAKRVRSKEDGELLDIGLAAVSIEEGVMDPRDLSFPLEELRKAAKKAGIDSTSHIKAMIGKSGGAGAQILNSLLWKK